MKCFACDKKLGKNPALADIRDGQTAFVGTECYRAIKASGEEGFQPEKGGPRLWTIPKGLSQAALDDLHKNAVRL